MKCLQALAVILVAAGAALGSAGPGGQQSGMPGMTMEATVSSGMITVQNDTVHRVLTIRVGPVSLRHTAARLTMSEVRHLDFKIPFDGWLTGYHPQMVDGSGKPAPGRLLHHVAFYDLARTNMLCSSKPDHIFGAGGEMNDWPVQPGFGYAVRKGDRILVNTMYRNDLGKTYSNIYFQVKVNYQLAGNGTALKGVYPAWFDVKECGNSSYDLKPGRNVNRGEFRMRYQGRLLGVGGHLHDFGNELILADATHNKTIAVLHPKLAPNGKILSMPIVSFAHQGGYPLERGDVIKVTAIYNNPTGHELKNGAMGIVVGYFLPSTPTEMAGLQRK
ncbi:MAG: hypothetical protein ACRD3T_15160 [Terriglobia bacterium]